MTERAELEKAIAVLEAQRAILGDAVVDAAVAPIREQLAAQEQTDREAGVPLPGERKLITVLFADVVGSTAMAERHDAETTRLILYRCLRLMSEAVDEFGGTISSLMGDGLMAFFGIPQAYENDPERAALAAQRIHKKVTNYAAELDLPLEVRVGINTGRVILSEMGEIAGEERSEHASMGQPPVNLAARLQGAARPGATLLGESTARMVRYRFGVEPVESLDLKGFDEPVPAYELLGQLAEPARDRGIPGLQSALVGRDGELEQLVEMAEGLEQGIGGIAALIGEPGIGKSRLLAETKEASRNGRLRFAEGRAYSYTQDQPFSVVLDLLKELLDLAADDSPAIMDLKLESALSTMFQRELETIWPFLATLLGAPVPPQYATALIGLDPEALHAGMIRAVQLLVERMAERHRLVLSFEDLHWADGGSLKLIEALMLDTEYYPLLVILLFRPDRDIPAWQLKLTAETHFAHRYLELPLSPLGPDASAEMSENLLQVTNLPTTLQDTIVEKAQGNPLYVEELIRSLIDNRVLVQEEKSWKMRADQLDLAVPETLEKVIQARLDRLPPAERTTLQVASVIGRRFSYRVLEGMAAADGDLRNQLLRLQQAGMVREHSRLPEPEYIFKHVIVQEVTYGTLLSDQRRRLHRSAAETLEELFPDRREELAGTLAEHWAAAGEKRWAMDLFVRAASRAKEVYAYQEAINYFSQALALSDVEKTLPEERIMLLEQLADTHYLRAEGLESFRLCRKALDLFESLGDGDKWTAVRLHRKLAEAWWLLPVEDERRLESDALASLKTGLKLTEGERPHPETVRLLIMASNYALWPRSESWRSPVPGWRTEEECALTAVKMAEQLDAPVELSAALKALSQIHNMRGRLRDCLQVEQRRQQLSRDARFDDLREKVDILIDTAIAFKMVGDYAQAIPHLLKAAVLGEQIRDRIDQSRALLVQAECWLRLDRWDEVHFTEKKIRGLQKRYPLERIGPVCWLLGYSAAAHALRGEEAMAARLAEESYLIMTDTVFIPRGGGANQEGWNIDQFY